MESQKRRIAHGVIWLESKGHLQWKVAQAARKAGVSRALVYYHFGRSKREILEKSALLVAEEFFGLSPERMLLLERGKAVESLLMSRELFHANPAFALFYLKWRTAEGPLREMMIGLEERYQKALRKVFRLPKAEITALHGLFYAVVTAPFLDEGAVRKLVRLAGRIT